MIGLNVGAPNPNPAPTMVFWIGEECYLLARVAIRAGMTAPSVLLAEQAVEMLIKAQLRLENIQVPKHHRLTQLLATGQGQIATFGAILADATKVAYLDQLEAAYNLMRFGEAGYQISFLPFRDRLDEIAFILRLAYLNRVGSPNARVYLIEPLHEPVLWENAWFTAAMLSGDSAVRFEVPYPGIPI